ncbi:TPA: hypothetical protein ACJW70_000927 [Streptococcus pneumoniae]|nr:transposase [Streptococcus pneumoniae]CVP39797.1 transposase [Streptococcus pneumoniae]CVW90679.1 transposase [Streptococcus pneumoniae]SNG94095.1 transposase [Streptococcus pneumoniae]SNH86225.1 transposase [Streptococcus pneumoniae]SNL78410.1 transposase [Streptococcus pneumoniae]
MKTVVADAGYGSEENLLRLEEKEVNHLIKYAMFDKEQKRGYNRLKLKQYTKTSKTLLEIKLTFLIYLFTSYFNPLYKQSARN